MSEELKLEEVPSEGTSALECSRRGELVHLAIDAPSSGDTSGGFGRWESVTLTRAQAERLGWWLLGQA